jgi:hypothetical protein
LLAVVFFSRERAIKRRGKETYLIDLNLYCTEKSFLRRLMTVEFVNLMTPADEEEIAFQLIAV